MAVTVTAVGTGGKCGIYNSGYYGTADHIGQGLQLRDLRQKSERLHRHSQHRLEDSSSAASNIYTITNASLTTTWTKYSFTLTATRSLAAARLAITTQSTGTFYLTFVSVMPGECGPMASGPTCCRCSRTCSPASFVSPAGVTSRATASPTPGSGRAESDRRKPAARTGLWGYWDHQRASGSTSSLLLCEKLGAEPLLVVNCGMSQTDTVTGPALAPYIQDALDAIEFANGDSGTTWGAQRVAMGHTAPFNLKYIGDRQRKQWIRL